MKHNILMVFFLMGLFVAIPQLALAGDQTQEQIAEWKLKAQGWSIQDHLAATKAEEEKVQSLENRLQHLYKRISNLEKKPYLDPKGITRNSLNLSFSTLKGEIKLLNEKIAWHFRQADLAQLTK